MPAVFEAIKEFLKSFTQQLFIIYCNILLFRITNECICSLDMLSQIISLYKLALLHGTGGSFIYFTSPENLCPSGHVRAAQG